MLRRWNGLDHLKRQNWDFFCVKSNYVTGSCARELNTFHYINLRVRQPDARWQLVSSDWTRDVT